MKYIISIIIVVMICTAFTCSSGASDKQIIDNLIGVWISQRYLDSLEATKSPCSAVRSVGGNITAFWIKKDQEGFIRTLIGEMHDSAVEQLQTLEDMEEKNSYRVVVPERGNVTDIITILSSDTLRWRYGSENMVTDEVFVRISSEKDKDEEAEVISGFINKVVLVGTYRDLPGRLFSFTEEGRALWPDTAFEYSIGIDCTMIDVDYIQVKGKKREGLYYSFGWDKGQLQIFSAHINEDGVLERSGKPVHILTKETINRN